MTALRYEIAAAYIGKLVTQNPMAVISPMEGSDLRQLLPAESR
jgi:hypothetical protein